MSSKTVARRVTVEMYPVLWVGNPELEESFRRLNTVGTNLYRIHATIETDLELALALASHKVHPHTYGALAP